MDMHKINISEIEGFRLGNAENKVKGTGCTVIICEDGGVGGVDVRGGAPATRETDLLRSENTVNEINAVVLSGGSAFGLEAASGVMRELSKREVGFKVGDVTVPIVCGASLFDLAVGDHNAFPDINMGAEAVRNAFRGGFEHGNCGAGTGATVGKIAGTERSMKTGLGTYACSDGTLHVGAVSAVNAVGDVYNGAGNIIAGLRSEDGESISGTIKALKGMLHDNPAGYKEKPKHDRSDKSEKSEKHEMPENQNSMSDQRTAVTAAEPSAKNPRAVSKERSERMIRVAEALKEEFRKTNQIEKSRFEAEIESARKAFRNQTEAPAADHVPASVEDAYITMPESSTDISMEKITAEAYPSSYQEGSSAAEVSARAAGSDDEGTKNEDYGYDIAFNTTISCLITNAILTKSQANKLAAILHDAYARAIKPVHTTMDGDTIFVLTTGRQKVNFDAFAALATDVMQYAIIDGALSAKAAYGLPSSRDMRRI